MNNNLILEKLQGVKMRQEELEQQLSNPDVMVDIPKFVKINKEYKDLGPIVEAYKEYKDVLSNIEASKQLLADEKDPEMKEMAKLELDELTPKVEMLEDKIRFLLLPVDPEDSKNAIVEIRAGTGGDEASIFAGDLYRMYIKFCESKKWKTTVTNISEGTVGGYKEIVFEVEGDGVYGILKYESGVHRVQRVPQTETQGRVHTSAATIAVLPEAEEFDVDIKMDDIKKETFCASGPGGQSVNTTYSAIRLTHGPTGISVQCQDQKSQIKNLDKAMTELRTRIYNLQYQAYLDEISKKRKTMVSSGDRSAKIRTYNYPQSRITDHRINLTLYNLPTIMDGALDEIIEKLQFEENAERLKESAII